MMTPEEIQNAIETLSVHSERMDKELFEVGQMLANLPPKPATGAYERWQLQTMINYESRTIEIENVLDELSLIRTLRFMLTAVPHAELIVRMFRT